MRNDFTVELDNRVIKTSPCENHTENPAPRPTSLLNPILVGRRNDDKQPRFQTAWFLGLIDGSEKVIALHPDGVQRHHGEWRVCLLSDPESKLRELKSALALMTEVDWRTPGCKTCQDIRYHKGWNSEECRERVLPTTVVKGINPAPHIHEHLRYTIMATALRTPSRITTSRLSTLR